ncbi:type II secretion system protein [Chitinimonas naiadis]
MRSAGAVRHHRGFTLIELMVTLAILAVLAMLVVPSAQVAIQRVKEQDLKLALREIRGALDAYKRAFDSGRIQRDQGASGYPASLMVLVDGVPDQLDPKGGKLYFLRRIPTDPWCAASEQQGLDQCWGKRSYASTADEPQEGVDVYDVYSRAEGVGLNGLPYRRW